MTYYFSFPPSAADGLVPVGKLERERAYSILFQKPGYWLAWARIGPAHTRDHVFVATPFWEPGPTTRPVVRRDSLKVVLEEVMEIPLHRQEELRPATTTSSPVHEPSAQTEPKKGHSD